MPARWIVSRHFFLQLLDLVKRPEIAVDAALRLQHVLPPQVRAVLEALEMPAAGVRTWLEQNKARCEQLGGRLHYAELLDLYDDCLALVEKPEG